MPHTRAAWHTQLDIFRFSHSPHALCYLLRPAALTVHPPQLSLAALIPQIRNPLSPPRPLRNFRLPTAQHSPCRRHPNPPPQTTTIAASIIPARFPPPHRPAESCCPRHSPEFWVLILAPRCRHMILPRIIYSRDDEKLHTPNAQNNVNLRACHVPPSLKKRATNLYTSVPQLLRSAELHNPITYI